VTRASPGATGARSQAALRDEYSAARKARPDRTGQRLRRLARVVRGALASGAAGVNILLYGPPGTGKTEFCKVLAERLGASLYSVGGTDDTGDEPVRGERLQELRLAQRLLAGNRGSLLLFDEMEDLLADPFPAWGLFGPRSRMAQRNTQKHLDGGSKRLGSNHRGSRFDARETDALLLRREVLGPHHVEHPLLGVR